jgi:hypothetical protein
VASKKKTSRPRTVRREQDRALEKLGDARQKLAALEDGGSPGRPREVTSAAVIEGQARSLGCPRGCEGEARVKEHTAETIDGARLRVVTTECPRCGTRRSVYFNLRSDAPN